MIQIHARGEHGRYWRSEIPILSNDAIYIEREQKHRMENASDNSLTFIEVQAGDTLDENDIVRYQDDYGRS